MSTMFKCLVVTIGLTAGAALPAEAGNRLFVTDSRSYRSDAPAENPNYQVNRYGYGNYLPGPDGGLGGYPAGSAGDRELQIYQELKCRYSPESC